MALRIRLTNIEEWWQSLRPGLRNRSVASSTRGLLVEDLPVALPSFRLSFHSFSLLSPQPLFSLCQRIQRDREKESRRSFASLATTCSESIELQRLAG